MSLGEMCACGLFVAWLGLVSGSDWWRVGAAIVLFTVGIGILRFVRDRLDVYWPRK